MANEINMSSGDRCDERKKMMEQPGSEGVAQESDDLPILEFAFSDDDGRYIYKM
jgi:hypothetical protein